MKQIKLDDMKHITDEQTEEILVHALMIAANAYFDKAQELEDLNNTNPPWANTQIEAAVQSIRDRANQFMKLINELLTTKKVA